MICLPKILAAVEKANKIWYNPFLPTLLPNNLQYFIKQLSGSTSDLYTSLCWKVVKMAMATLDIMSNLLNSVSNAQKIIVCISNCNLYAYMKGYIFLLLHMV